MSEPVSPSEIPDNIGRNDPCPCGSGNKYKKCCQRAHRLQKESEKAANQPHRLIGPKSIPLRVYKVLAQVNGNNAIGLFYDLTHDAGPFRTRYKSKSDFVTAIDGGEALLPAGKDFEFRHFRLDAPETYLVLEYEDPKRENVDYQVITLRRNEINAEGEPREVDHQGYRIWDVKSQSFPRGEYDGLPPLSAFGIEWRPAAS